MINYGIFAIGITVTIIALLFLKKDVVQNTKVDLINVKEEQRKLIECIEIGEEIIREINQVGIHTIEKIDKKTLEIRDLLQKCEDQSFPIVHEVLIQKTFQEPVSKIEKDILIQESESQESIPVNVVPEEDLSEKILKLRASGYTLSQIARELGKGIGEVQLILQLKKR